MQNNVSQWLPNERGRVSILPGRGGASLGECCSGNRGDRYTYAHLCHFCQGSYAAAVRSPGSERPVFPNIMIHRRLHVSRAHPTAQNSDDASFLRLEAQTQVGAGEATHVGR